MCCCQKGLKVSGLVELFQTRSKKFFLFFSEGKRGSKDPGGSGADILSDLG